MTDLYMRILLSAQSGNTMSVVSGVAKALGSGGLGGALLGIGVAATGLAVGLGVASVKASADFQQAMLSNVAHAGLAKSQIDSVSASVLKMATEVGRDPTQLAEALYPILSAFSGIQNQSAKSAIALDTLRMSFQAVAGTAVNGTDVANAAVGTFNALGLATNNVSTNTARMKALFDVMDLTVQQGNMQWDAYKNVISKLAVSIQGTGVKFNEASAALATLTNEGYSAQRAQTYLSNMFTTMAIKTDAMAKHAKALKITFNENAYASMDLAGKVNYLNQVTDGNKQKLLALLGGNATALKSFNALSTGLASYKSNLDGLNHSRGALQASFDTASQGFNFAMQRLGAAGQVLLVTIGTGLLPVLTRLVNAVIPLVAQFAVWLTSTDKANSAGATMGAIWRTVSGVIATLTPAFRVVWAVLTQIGAFLAATFVPVWQQLVATFKSDLLPAWNDLMTALAPIMPELKIFGEILGGTVVVAILLAVAVIAGLVKALAGLLETTIKIFGGIAKIVSGAIQVVSGVISFFVDFFTGKWSKLGQDIATIVGGWVRIFQGVWQVITNIFTGAIDFLKNLVGGFVSSISNMISGIGSAISGVHVPGHAAGILNSPVGHMAVVGEKGPELMYIPRGASIFPNSALSSFGRSGGTPATGSHTTIFYISLNTMARSQSEVSRMVDLFEQELAHRFRNQTAGYSTGGVF